MAADHFLSSPKNQIRLHISRRRLPRGEDGSHRLQLSLRGGGSSPGTIADTSPDKGCCRKPRRVKSDLGLAEVGVGLQKTHHGILLRWGGSQREYSSVLERKT